jgi:hypothetical protein
LVTSVIVTACGGGDSPAPQAARVAVARTQPLSSLGYPFGSRKDAYATTMRVSGTPSALDAQIHTWYQNWFTARLQQTAYGWINKGGNCYATSESTGYAMLITVAMAGDPNGDLGAKGVFDGLLATAIHDYAASIDPSYTFTDPAPAAGTTPQQLADRNYLMGWCVDSTGQTDTSGDAKTVTSHAYNAIDGDLDIALALLMADRQWGSDPTDGSPQNYLQRALRTIRAIESFNVDSAGNILSKGLAFPGLTRSSDLMVGHFRAFKQATGDAVWDEAVDRAFAQIGSLQQYAQTSSGMPTGLLPDWIQNSDTASAQPAASDPEGDYYYNKYGGNAQRDPLRFASDYVFSAATDTRWTGNAGELTRIAQFFSTTWNNQPTPLSVNDTNWNMGIYDLNGTLIYGYQNQAMAAAVMTSAMVSPQYQQLLDNTWNWLNNVWPTSGYYESDLALLSMLVVSGNWWQPTAAGGTTTPPPPPPPPSSGPLHVEAENGTLQGSGVSVRTDLAGYSGTGFVGSFTSAGDTLTVSFPNVTAGTYSVRIHYHAWTAQQNNVSVNGAMQSVQFPASTPTTSDWVDVTLPAAALPAGTTTVVISKDWGYIDVDYVELIPTATKVQAEDGQLSNTGGISVRTDLAGYEGTGFVGSFTNTGDTLTVSFPGVTAGTYTVSIRYHAWTAQQNNVTINGATQSVQFPASTPTTSDWVVVQIPNVSLVSGTNTISISKDWGYIDVDWIQVGT